MGLVGLAKRTDLRMPERQRMPDVIPFEFRTLVTPSGF